jgi:hypothetical protein
VGSSDDLADSRPQYRNHNAATLPLQASDGNAKFIHLSTDIHITHGDNADQVGGETVS